VHTFDIVKCTKNKKAWWLCHNYLAKMLFGKAIARSAMGEPLSNILVDTRGFVNKMFQNVRVCYN
jgi:hypothetical protein